MTSRTTFTLIPTSNSRNYSNNLEGWYRPLQLVNLNFDEAGVVAKIKVRQLR